MKPRFELGQEVRVIRNVRNDGTFPGRDVGELLLRRGATGFVRDVGTFLQDQLIYAIDFIEYGYRVGCREVELVPVEEEWTDSRYEFRDWAELTASLSAQGEVVARKGALVQVMKVVRDAPGEVHYHVVLQGRTFLVPERLLTGDSEFDERLRLSREKGWDATSDFPHATLPWQSLGG